MSTGAEPPWGVQGAAPRPPLSPQVLWLVSQCLGRACCQPLSSASPATLQDWGAGLSEKSQFLLDLQGPSHRLLRVSLHFKDPPPPTAHLWIAPG